MFQVNILNHVKWLKISFLRLEGPKSKVNLCCSSYRFTQIAVDPQVKTPGGKAYDVLFIGTGKFTKHWNPQTVYN